MNKSTRYEEVIKTGRFVFLPTGEIKSIQQNRMLVVGLDKYGYHRVTIRMGDKFYALFVHRLIAFALIPNPENKPIINHKNGIKTDNRVENLEWCTNKENIIHSFEKLGRIGKSVPKGSKSPSSVLKESDINHIRTLLKQGETLQFIANQYKCSLDTIFKIKHNITWKHVPAN